MYFVLHISSVFKTITIKDSIRWLFVQKQDLIVVTSAGVMTFEGSRLLEPNPAPKSVSPTSVNVNSAYMAGDQLVLNHEVFGNKAH
jgi:hypothetical protein